VINETQTTAQISFMRTRQNALAALTNLGHITPFNS